MGTRLEDVLPPHPSFATSFGDRRSWGGGINNAYRDWLREAISDEELDSIRAHMQQERALGDPRFQQMVSETLQRPSVIRSRGRPRRRFDAEL